MKNNNKLVPFLTKSLKRSYIFTERHAPTVASFFVMIFKGIMKPIMAAKAALYRNPNIRPIIKQIPWIPLGLIILTGTILMYKDLNFNLNLSAPTGGGGFGGATSSAVAQPMMGDNAAMFGSFQEQKNREYIQNYRQLAISEMETYGVPASILLAQGLIESKAGENAAATLNNNHFSIKCFSKKCRKGHCSNLEQIGHKAFYRKYSKVEDSWRAHSLLVTTGKYRHLTKHSDYQSWANGLQQAGYHGAKDYAKRLIELVQYYGLQKLDV